MADESFMDQYVVYKNPRDYPGKFVVRHWAIMKGGNIQKGDCLAVSESKESALESIPPGLYKLPRQPNDDPAIVEVWI